MDATHFRQRAAQAREMAQIGDDVRLSRMLLEVAVDLDAEAEAIEAEATMGRPGSTSTRRFTFAEALLEVTGADSDPV